MKAKGALIGAFIGGLLAVLYADVVAQHHGLGTAELGAAMLVIPFVFGYPLARFARLPHPVVFTLVGGVAANALGWGLLALAPRPYPFAYDETLNSGVFVLAATLGFLATTWLLQQIRFRDLALVLGGCGVVFAGSLVFENAMHEWYETIVFNRQEAALLAPDLPGFTLRSAEAGVTIMQEFTRGRLDAADDTWANVRIYSQVSDADIRAVCTTPLPPSGWGDADPPCRQVGPDLWARGDVSTRLIFVRRGPVILQMEGSSVSEAELVAMVDTLHPVRARDLARLNP